MINVEERRFSAASKLGNETGFSSVERPDCRDMRIEMIIHNTNYPSSPLTITILCNRLSLREICFSMYVHFTPPKLVK